VGNISTIADSLSVQTQTYGYDALDRLTSWALNGVTETYAYSDSSGNLVNKNGLVLGYPAANGSNPTHPHAVTSANGNTYAYDANGNQTTRHIGSDTFTLLYDAENRLVEVKKNNVTTAQFTFDGDGKRVKSVIGAETILFAGGHYEKKGSTITKYYFAGASRIAMRKYMIPQNMTVEYFLGDHLGSTSITTDNAGVKVSEMRYKPWGELRYSWTNAPAGTSPTYELTKYQFTGQYSYNTEFGLMFYGARFYDSAVGRFVSADTIVPGGVQGLDRYAYVGNNPIRFTDPSGHRCVPADECDTLHGDLAPLPLLEFATDPGQSFTDEEIQIFESDAQKTAEALAREINSGCSDEAHALGICYWVSPEDAFYATFGGPIKVKRVDDTCATCYAEYVGEYNGQYTIWVYSNTTTQDIINSPGLLVHEIGHAFHNAYGRKYPDGDVYYPNGFDPYYENRSSNAPNEIFADMFTGWVYGKWETNPLTGVLTTNGAAKSDYMNKNMPGLIHQAIGW
jgi:RHS repeat-associated protein